MGFRLASRSMTLDDLELLQGQILSDFRVISRFWDSTTAKRMKIDQRCIDYVDISWRSAARGRQTREGLVKSAVFYL